MTYSSNKDLPCRYSSSLIQYGLDRMNRAQLIEVHGYGIALLIEGEPEEYCNINIIEIELMARYLKGKGAGLPPFFIDGKPYPSITHDSEFLRIYRPRRPR